MTDEEKKKILTDKLQQLTDVRVQGLKDIFYDYRNRIDSHIRNMTDEMVTIKKAVGDMERSCWDVDFEDLESVVQDLKDNKNRFQEALQRMRVIQKDIEIILAAIDAEIKNFEGVVDDGRD